MEIDFGSDLFDYHAWCDQINNTYAAPKKNNKKTLHYYYKLFHA